MQLLNVKRQFNASWSKKIIRGKTLRHREMVATVFLDDTQAVV